MTNEERFYIKLQSFFLAELSRLEEDLNEASDSMKNMSTIKNNNILFLDYIVAKSRLDYFNGWYSELLRFLKNCE